MENPFWSINAGHVITIVSIMAGAWVNRAANTARLQKMETKLDLMFQWFVDKIQAAEEEDK